MEDTTKYSRAIRTLSGFAARVKTGYFGHGREVASGTVSSALTAVGQAISMEQGNNPLKMKNDKLLHPLAVMMSGYRKWDKPTHKKAAIGVDVVEYLCSLGQKLGGVKDGVIGDFTLIAFYYLLRVGEYTQKNQRQNSKQTVEFRMRDVVFFGHDSKGRLKQLSRKADDETILNAVGGTLCLSNQKNGWKNVCIFHFANGDAITCPIMALARRFVHIRQHAPEEYLDLPLSSYFVNGVRCHLRDTDVRAALKDASVDLGYPDKGIPRDNVDTHSLRAGGANALHLNGYSDREIQKMGRWKSNTFKEYISESLDQFSLGMSKAMKKDFQFVNIAAGVDAELVDVTSDLVNTPYDVGTMVAAVAVAE